MGKKKILWVVYDFVQAGGQRYVYEICKALDKEKYEIHLLKVAGMNHDKNWDHEFYYQPTIELGCKIILLADAVKHAQKTTNRKLKNSINSLFKVKPGNGKSDYLSKTLLDIFNQYHIINFSGISVYLTTCIQNNLHPKNGFIHILTFGFQHLGMYNEYDKNKAYKFISPVTPGAVKKDLKGFSNYTFTYFPLCFETIPYEIVQERNHGKSRIAIFTRLSSMKPLDPFFYALKILLEQETDVELNVYGSGDPEALGLIKQLDYLYITDHVKFLGHSDSIPETLRDNTPDLLWFQSANKEPGGYAAFEISMSGLPQLFWDFMDTSEYRPIEKVFPSFTNITDFVSFTRQILNDHQQQKELGEKQRNFVLEHYSIKSHIHILEELFDA